jgi:hypothetical protein
MSPRGAYFRDGTEVDDDLPGLDLVDRAAFDGLDGGHVKPCCLECLKDARDGAGTRLSDNARLANQSDACSGPHHSDSNFKNSLLLHIIRPV